MPTPSPSSLPGNDQSADTEAQLRARLTERPADVAALQTLGAVLAGQGRYGEAEEAFARALAIDPGAADALFNLGVLHQMAGRHEAAIECYRRLLSLGAPTADLLVNIGNAYIALQHIDEAIAAYRQAVALAPHSPLALNNLGLALAKAGRTAEATATFEQAIAAAPADPDPLLNLAQLQLTAGRLIEPAALLEKALTLRPELTEPRQALAQLCVLRGDVEAAIALREEAIRRQPHRPELYRELILDLNFADGDDGGRVAAACRDWHRRFAPDPAAPQFHGIDPDPERRLRIGYVGGQQFRSHTLAAVILPLIEAHGDAVELTGYSDLPAAREDDVTRHFQRRMRWRRTGELSDEGFAQAVADDHIDILIDPVGFTGGSRLLALARRPAPLQISFPVMGTCGGPTIDYVLVDDVIAPDPALSHFSERALRVPFAYCYRPLSALPDIGDPPCERSGFVTFGSLNALPKIGPRAIRAWGRILDQVERSRLVVKAGFPFRDPMVQEHFLRRLAAEGVDASRVTLQGWLPHERDHMALHNEIDIALDSFPYCGVTTTYEALAMGVPVITRAGTQMLGRYAADILRAAGLADGIAEDDDGYVARAVTLARDRDRLRALRRSLHGMLFNSPACDAPRTAGSIENALRSAWRDWCARAKHGWRG
jgi:protein O-GlcNAc transferase